jgi:hypothetical protein
MPQSRGCARFPQKTFAHCLRAADLDDLKSYIAMKGPFGGAISHTHGAASQLPQRTILAPRDLEIIEKRGWFGSVGFRALI